VKADGSDDQDGAAARRHLAAYAPELLLVAFGHPKQEMWIARHLPDLPSVKVAVGIGGTLDYWSGAKKRAPQFLRSLGLEWFWRLMQEPKRWRRIFDAVVVFPSLVLWDKIRKV
jgi:N-acetylglucosaminyldiphosphoundecaprenol N-acetyl-beta-D-mannosaminyltransferase